MLDRLVADVSAVAAGDFGRVVAVGGPAEVAAVGRAISTMRDQLAEHAKLASLEEARRARVLESDRMAELLAGDVILELSAITHHLTSLAGQDVRMSEPLLAMVRRLDGAIEATRAAIYDIPVQRDAGDAVPPFPPYDDPAGPGRLGIGPGDELIVVPLEAGVATDAPDAEPRHRPEPTQTGSAP